MNNLEKLKEVNPAFYQDIKLKYVTNAQNIKSLLDNIDMEYYQEQISAVSSIKELENLEHRSSMISFMKERLHEKMKETEETKKKILETLMEREIDINDLMEKIRIFEK
jgi:galactose-1-phosphate uridylyltransferase